MLRKDDPQPGTGGDPDVSQDRSVKLPEDVLN